MFTKRVHFITPGGWGLCARAWPNKSYLENALFLENRFLYSRTEIRYTR